MKTVKSFLTIFALLVTGIVSAQTVKVDCSKSTVKWTAEKIGGAHDGFVTIKSGEFKLKDDKIASGTFVIDMKTITCADIENAEYNKKLVDHLNSEDFFAVTEHPTSTLVLTSSTKFKDNKATATGSLTVKGKTLPTSFVIVRDGGKYSATVMIDRAKYDIRYGSKSFFDNLGDKVIYDEFKLDVVLVTL